MGLMDSIKGMFGGGDGDDAIPVEETITEPAEPMGEDASSEPMSAPEPTPEPEAEPVVEETPEPAGDEPMGGVEANMDAKKCGNCGADFGTCEHTSTPVMA